MSMKVDSSTALSRNILCQLIAKKSYRDQRTGLQHEDDAKYSAFREIRRQEIDAIAKRKGKATTTVVSVVALTWSQRMT